jgi:hypothetical protein
MEHRGKEEVGSQKKSGGVDEWLDMVRWIMIMD